MIPEQIGVVGSKDWEKKDLTEIKDYKAIEKKMDWSYCTPYKGSVQRINYSDASQNPFLLKIRVELCLAQEDMEPLEIESHKQNDLELVQNPENGIPLEMLGPENEILNSGEIVLYEDELADRGSSKCYVRYRVMADCWFVLLRSYIRLDKVAVRIMDTRIFHKFGSNEIIRDFIVKEDSWDNLSTKGFIFNSEWLLSPY